MGVDLDGATISQKVSWTAVRGIELVLAVSGLFYFIVGPESPPQVALFLLCWVTVAFFYLTVGAIRVRRTRFPGGRPSPPVIGRRFSFLLTAAASLTGLGAALAVLSNDDVEYGPVITGLGAMAMVCAWMLLHVGYARFYATWASDLRFPGTDPPGLVDFLYFAMTLGVSFAVSDIEIQSRPLRWHVMVHSVLSFFYNAVVLAVAINIITGR